MSKKAETQDNEGTDELHLVMQPDADTLSITTSEFEQAESAKAQSMREFDDSKIRVMGHKDVPMDIRSSRGKPSQLVLLDNLYIVPGMNVRLDTPEWDDHIEWLTGRILEEGFREDQPLLVFATKDDAGQIKYGIISGESRFHATHRANKRGADIKALPVYLAAEGMSIEEMTIQLATSNTTKPFTPLESSVLAQRFSKWGRAPAEISLIMKVSLNYVLQLLKIARAPNRIRAMIQDGSVPFQVALAALNNDPANAVENLEKGVIAAKAAGRDRATAKFMPEQQAQKAARHHAPQMKTVLQKLTGNEGMMALMDDEIREEIERLLTEIDTMAAKTPADVQKAKDEKLAKSAAKKAERAASKAAAPAKASKKKPANDVESGTQDAAKEPAAPAKKTTKAAKTTKTSKSKPESSVSKSSATTRVREHFDSPDDFQQHPND